MKDWREKRRDTLAELTLGAHILAYLVAIIILIAGTPLVKHNFYDAIVLLVATIFPATVFILLDNHMLQRGYERRAVRAWNIAKHTLLFAVVTGIFATIQREQLWLFSSIYLIPVVLSSITLGKWWGTAFAGAAAGSIFLVLGKMDFAGNQAVGSFEAALVLGAIFFLLVWLLGGVIEVEKKTTAQIRQERDLIAQMMDTSPAGIVVLDHRRNVLYNNTRVEQILGLPGSELRDFFNRKTNGGLANTPGCSEEVFQKVIAGGEPVLGCQGKLSGSGEKPTYISVSGAPIFNSDGCIEQVVLTVDDITRQKITSEEMLKADKLESLGLLAGGIAHDFNNLLAVILGNVSLAKMRSGNEKIADNLEHMEKAVLQARELTRKLFVFAKGGAPVKKTVYLQILLLDTVGFALSGSAVTCETEVADDLLPVEADESQLGQVINNILINAQQAMPKGGKIKLAAANLTIGGDEEAGVPPLPEGEYVRIGISDEGIGIPPDLLGKIFDPYFSTKPHGSGLGLATAYTIISNHNGMIRVESQPGSGATFYIYLPASTKPDPDPRENDEALCFGEGRVLIMDDDELILKSCGEMLKCLGYHVSYARDGAEAVRLYREALATSSRPAYDMVIMDLTIPGGIGGKEVLKQLQRFDPTVKAIVCSGYPDTPAITNYKEYGFSGFVRKPYCIKELSRALRQLSD